MYAIVAKLNVREGQEADFEKIFLDHCKAVRENEPGNKMYELYKTGDGGYVVLEQYADDTALQAHRDAPHQKALGEKLRGMMAGAPGIERLTRVGG